MKIVSVCNQKGGVGKTTTTAALAIALSRAGQRVHVIDADPQSSLTRKVFNYVDKDSLLYTALDKRIALPIVDCGPNLTLTPATMKLGQGEMHFLDKSARERLLERAIQQSDLPADATVLIDCPPNLGLMTVNSLTASDYLVIPMDADELALDALLFLEETIKNTQKYLNPKLVTLGMILTKVDDRYKITRQFLEAIPNAYTLLGTVHAETNLKYATGGGRLPVLQNSRALSEYEAIANKIKEAVWRKTTASATA